MWIFNLYWRHEGTNSGTGEKRAMAGKQSWFNCLPTWIAFKINLLYMLVPLFLKELSFWEAICDWKYWTSVMFFSLLFWYKRIILSIHCNSLCFYFSFLNFTGQPWTSSLSIWMKKYAKNGRQSCFFLVFCIDCMHSEQCASSFGSTHAPQPFFHLHFMTLFICLFMCVCLSCFFIYIFFDSPSGFICRLTKKP